MNRLTLRSICAVVCLRAMLSLILAGSPLLIVSCSRPSETAVDPGRPETVRAGQPRGERDFKQRQIAFLNRIREADPEHRVIDHALLNKQNELGVILARTVEMNRIPDLMRSLLTQMAHEFPQQDLTVIAYASANPPLKIGTARFDAGRREMNYYPEH